MKERLASLLRSDVTRLRIKVCCISSIAEARLALDAGADALGLVSQMPSGPGVIADDAIAEIAAYVAHSVPTVLLTSRLRSADIADQVQRSGVAIVQIVDALPPGELEALGKLLPATGIMPVIHVRDQASVAEAVRLGPDSDFLLLDSGNPSAAVKELGGTGRVHDWNVSRQLVREVARPVFLAGGLNAENVASAITLVSPFGIDVCSGVRRAGRLDPVALRAFVDAARGASTI